MRLDELDQKLEMKNSQEAVAGSVCAQVREVSGQNMSSLWGGERELHQGGNIAGRGRDYGHSGSATGPEQLAPVTVHASLLHPLYVCFGCVPVKPYLWSRFL